MRRARSAMAVVALLAAAGLAAVAASVHGEEAAPANVHGEEAAPAGVHGEEAAPSPAPVEVSVDPETVPPVEPAGEAPPWARRVSDAVSPGPLAEAHADLEGVTRCNECHSWLGGTPDAACLACHEEIGKRMAARTGHHGRLEGRCADCHADHRGADVDLLGLDHGSFAHDRALFALRGAHADVACDDCHLREDPKTGRKAFRPIGVARRCAGCHESPHGDRLVRERECESCHVATAWTAPAPAIVEGAGFDHDVDTRFPLDAIHAGAACTGCHEPGSKQPPPRECASCHGDAAALLSGRFGGRRVAPDPHAKGATCRECHPAAMARPSLPEYAAVCVTCHPASYAALLATRSALLDEALVAARLVAKRPEERRRLDRLARSGLHHSELAEALALELRRTEKP